MKKIIFILTFVVGLIGCSSSPYVKGLREKPLQTEAVSHHEGRINGVNNLSLFEQSWLPNKSSIKASIIIVHGLKDHSDRYTQVAEQLTKNGYAVYAYDLRGHGDSEGQRVWVDSFDQYIGDLEIIYDMVKKAQPNKPIYIFGHSMGGAIATTFALKNTRSIDGLILSAPALKAGEDINAFLIGVTKILGSILPSLAVLELKDESFSRDPYVVNAMKNDKLIYQGKGPARTAKELLKTLSYIEDHMTELNIPFLALHGGKDVLTNPEGSKDLYQKAKTPDKTLKIYPDTYHDLLHEPEKDQIFSDILAWLNIHIKMK